MAIQQMQINMILSIMMTMVLIGEPCIRATVRCSQQCLNKGLLMYRLI